MSIAHTNAVFECDQFKGNTRSLLLALAYYSYDKGPYPKGFPDPGFGWCYRDEAFFMECLNVTRRQTISGCYSELAQAGVIRRKRRWHNSWLTFVDLEWLKSHARPQVSENVACEKEPATESVTSVPTDNVTCPQRKPLRSSTGSVTTSTSTVLRGSASSSSIKSNPLTTMIAPQVLPQAEAKPAPKTFDTEDDGLSFKEETPVPKPTAIPVIGLNGLKIPTCTYQNPCSDPNCTNQDCWLRRKADERHARKVVNKPIPTTPTKHCSCPNNSPFCVVCYSKQSIEDEIGAIS